MIHERPDLIIQALLLQVAKMVSDCLVYKMKGQVKLSMFPSKRLALNSDRMLWNCKVRTIKYPKVANFINMDLVKLHLSKPLVHKKWLWLEQENSRPGEMLIDTLTKKKITN